MSLKRKCTFGDFAEVLPETAHAKAINTGKQIDAAGKTQMMLLFGQKLQAQKLKAQEPYAAAHVAQCNQCRSAGASTRGGVCCHCAQTLCNGCLHRCYCCDSLFCATCSIFDYSEFETRSVCFDCSR